MGLSCYTLCGCLIFFVLGIDTRRLSSCSVVGCNLNFLGYSVFDDYFIELDFQLDIHGGHAAAGQDLAMIDKCQRLLVVSDLTLQ